MLEIRNKKGQFIKGITSWNKGKKPYKITEATRIKMSVARSGENNPMFGKKFTKEHRKKLSEAKIGKPSNRKDLSIDDKTRKAKRNWTKNKRNRVIKRLKIEDLSHTFGDWELLKKQYNFTCPCCKRKEPEIKLTEDHIVPLCKGGSDLIENIQPLCLKCNLKKHSKFIHFNPL